jgi:hypothetical protein
MTQRRQSFKTVPGRIVFYAIWLPLMVLGVIVARRNGMGLGGRLGVQLAAILVAWLVGNGVDKAVAARTPPPPQEDRDDEQ